MLTAPVFHRLHPLTVIVDLPRVLKQFLLVIVIAVAQMFRGGINGETQFEFYAAALGGIVVVPALLRYFSFAYAVHDGNLLIKSGIITKNLRTIPLDRIQNINLSRNLVHRVLGLVDLEIETAVGTKAEASISALGEEQAHVLRAQLLGQRPTVYAPHLAERQKTVVYKPTQLELFLAGASENKAGAILAAIAGLGILQPVLQNLIQDEAKLMFKRSFQLPTSGWLIGFAAFGAFVLFGWLTSIVSTFVKYYGFEITEEPGQLKRSFGLFNHVENVLPLRRIQTVHVSRNFLQAWLGICKIMVATAGGFGHHQRGQEHTQITESPLLTPVARNDAVPMLLERVMPECLDESTPWNPVSPKTILRNLRSSLLLSLLVAGGLAFVIKWWAIAVFVGFMGLGALFGWMHLKFGAWRKTGGLLSTRAGWLKRQWNHLPVNKVQCVAVTQSPAQRSLGLASLQFSSAAVAFQLTQIEDLDATSAFDLARLVHDESHKAKDSLLDGF